MFTFRTSHTGVSRIRALFFQDAGQSALAGEKEGEAPKVSPEGAQQKADETTDQLLNNPNASSEKKEQALSMRERRRQARERIQNETKNAITRYGNQVEAILALDEETKYKVEFENGEITQESLRNLLSDIDGKNGVQQANRGWFSRTFLGGGDQKGVLGEQQIRTLLNGKSIAEMKALYQRVTGDTFALTDANVGKNGQLNREGRSQMKKFYVNLLEQADVVATFSSVLLGDSDARTGARAVLEGRTSELEAALRDPKKLAQFQESLKNSKVLDRDPSFVQKMLSVLLRMGINAGFTVLSGGALGGYIEQSELSANDTPRRGDKLNASVRAGMGESGSAVASADMAGIRLEGNWNDPSMRIANRLEYFKNAEDKTQASSDLVAKIEAQTQESFGKKTSAKEQARFDEITLLGTAYKESQAKLLSLPASDARTEALNQNTLIYLSKVEAIRGFQLKGIFATANTVGFMAGLSVSRVNTSASFDGTKVEAGRIEAEVLGGKNLDEQKLETYLKTLGITRAEGKEEYLQNGEPLITAPEGKKIKWTITEVVTDKNIIIRATPTVISATEKVQATLVRTEARNDYFEKNADKVADFIWDLRTKNPKSVVPIQYAISANEYTKAETLLRPLLGKSSSTVGKELLGNLDSLKTTEEKKAFFDLLLEAASGGQKSRALGESIRKHVGNPAELAKDQKALEEYFKNTTARVFDKEYELTPGSALKEFRAIIQGGLPIAQLNNYSSDFSVAMVAYSQKAGFVIIDEVDHANAKTIGTPQEVSADVATKIREKAKTKITADEAKIFAETNGLVGKTEAEIKNLMVAGRVSSYLSFAEGAECFNLGFIVEPGEIEKTYDAESTVSQGSLVGRDRASVMNGGVGVGTRFEKEKGKQESRPGENGGTNDARSGGNTPPSGSTGTGRGPGGGTVPGGSIRSVDTASSGLSPEGIRVGGAGVLGATANAAFEGLRRDKKPETPEAPNK